MSVALPEGQVRTADENMYDNLHLFRLHPSRIVRFDLPIFGRQTFPIR